MHEFNICQTIVDTAISEMEKVRPRPRRLSRVHVVVGCLRQIVPESLRFAYEVLTKDTPAEKSEIDIRVLPLEGACNRCGWTGLFASSRFLCGKCGAESAFTVGGRELYLESIEVEGDG
jgi:hydrogenase nickel incorporation protein HypA/HybF